MPGTTEMLLAHRFDSGATAIDELIAPLAELAQDSPSLIVGYAPTASRRREDALPYFHVCGSSPERTPGRILVVGGWFGTEERSPYAIARLVAALEQNPALVAGFEVTAFPVANLHAHRSRTYLAPTQSLPSATCWDNSPLDHVGVLERELQRYPYDLVVLVREHPRTLETDLEAWLTEDRDKRTLGQALETYAARHAGLRCRINPATPEYRRTFTPIPTVDRQPAEVVVGLPAAKTSHEQTEEFSGVVLALLAAFRGAAV